MSTKKSGKIIVLAVALGWIFAGRIQADKLQLQEKLSADVEIQLRNATITEALDKIGQEAGVKFVLSDEAVWKLPHGEATRLSVTLGGSLADSMKEMLNAFFVRYVVGAEEITIYPRQELDHILGTPTTKQLELLKALYTKPIEVYLRDDVQQTVNAALGQKVLISPISVYAELNRSLRQLAGIESVDPRTRRRTGIGTARRSEPNEPEPTEFMLLTPVTVVQLLSQGEMVVRGALSDQWYISEMDIPGQMPEVRVVSSRIFEALKLDQKIDVSYKDESLDKVFRDLAKRAGMNLFVHPGSSLHEYKVSANMQDTTIRQAVTSIADMVGGTYEFPGGQIYVECYGRPKGKDESESTGKAARDSYVGKISIPMDGGKYHIEFMLRESDLTEELKKLRAEKIQEVTRKSTKPQD
jgi:hypothetical protein